MKQVKQMFDLTGKNALVTGASGGIGGAIARALKDQGAELALSGTRLRVPHAVQATTAFVMVITVPRHGG